MKLKKTNYRGNLQFSIPSESSQSTSNRNRSQFSFCLIFPYLNHFLFQILQKPNNSLPKSEKKKNIPLPMPSLPCPSICPSVFPSSYDVTLFVFPSVLISHKSNWLGGNPCWTTRGSWECPLLLPAVTLMALLHSKGCSILHIRSWRSEAMSASWRMK